MPTTPTPSRRVPVFFYGSFMRRDVMASGGLHPERIEVARLRGFDIRISPHASLVRSDAHSVCGILVAATHAELHRLYARDGVGVFLPEAIIAETASGGLLPATCYIPPVPGNEPPDIDYLDRLLAAAREHCLPEWYLDRLERCRSASAVA